MPYRWRCCQCDNSWIHESKTVCTWTQCNHPKCDNCEVKWMQAPLSITSPDRRFPIDFYPNSPCHGIRQIEHDSGGEEEAAKQEEDF